MVQTLTYFLYLSCSFDAALFMVVLYREKLWRVQKA